MFSNCQRIMLLFLVVIFGGNTCYSMEKEGYFVSLVGIEWQENTKIFRQPDGPFALIVFNDVYPVAGIIYYDIMGQPIKGAWKIDSRFWQEEEWADNITSFLWSPNGKYLFITTNQAYGTGNLYKLDLLQKKAEIIYPNKALFDKVGFTNAGYNTYIDSFNYSSRTIKVRVEFYKLKNLTNEPDKVLEETVKVE